MKKFLSVLMAFLVICCAVPFGASASEDTMSEEFKALLNEDGNLVLKAAPPTNIDEFYALIDISLTYKVPGFNFGNPASDFKSFDLIMNYMQSNEETHTVNVVYEYDPAVLEIAKQYTDNYPESNTFEVKDLEMVNYWVNGKKSYNTETEEEWMAAVKDFYNYSSEVKSFVDYKNFVFEIDNRAGSDWEIQMYREGIATLKYNDVIYNARSFVGLKGNHIIYVPDDTDTSKEGLLAAAQKRVNDYLGDETTFTMEYCCTIDDVIDEEGFDNYFGTEIDVEYCYSIKVRGEECPYLVMIVPDSEKMFVPTYKNEDILTNVSVSTASSSVPLDTNIEAEKLTDGEAYDEVIGILGVEENDTYDIKLHSNSLNDYITKLDNGTFEVKLPVAEELQDKELGVYYVDSNNTPVEYDVTVEDGFAVFATDHFSIYTLAEKKTSGDNALLGDADKDGKVNLNDLVILAQYVANWNVSCNAEVMNLNNDEKIDLNDIVYLARFLAGWSGYTL